MSCQKELDEMFKGLVIYMLEDIEKVHEDWLEVCRYFLGDKGYDNSKIILQLEGKGSTLSIDIRNCWKDGEETHQYRDTNLIYNYKGTVWYVGEDGERTELLYSRTCQRKDRPGLSV